MAKKRSKKGNRSGEMDVDDGNLVSTANACEAMDTSETVGSGVNSGGQGQLRKVNKGRPMKRSQNVRKKKALFKAVAQSEKSAEKISKTEGKLLRTKSAKTLYD